MKLFKNILLCTILFAATMLHSANVILNSSSPEVDLSKEVEVSSAQNLDLNHKLISDFKFFKNTKKTINIGYSDEVVLLKFVLESEFSNQYQHYIYLNSLNGFLNLYKINDKKQFEFIGSGGTDLPIFKRNSQGIFGAILLPTTINVPITYVLAMKSRHNVNAKLLISSEEKLFKNEQERLSFLQFYAGGIILLICYNLFLFVFLKDSVYLSYCFYAMSFMLASLVISGQLDQIFPLENFTFSHYLICFSAMALFSATLFSEQFLELRSFYPKAMRIIFGYKLYAFFIFICGLLPDFDRSAKLFGFAIDLGIFSGLLFFIYCAIKIIKTQELAKFYLLSWFFVLMSIIVWFGMTFGFLPINKLTQNSLPLGSMFEMLTLAIALAYKIEILNQEKIQALNKAKDKERYARLVRVLSHDVANSLTVVSSYSKKLMKNTELDSISRKQIEKIFHGSENIKNILQIVREQEVKVSKEMHIDLTDVNVLEALLFSKLLHEDLLQNKNINLVINIANSLVVKADKTCFINNILNNLLSNAIKFSYANSKIEIYSTESTDFTFIVIRDYGIGIRSDLVNDIFYSSKVVSTKGTEHEIGHGLGSSLIREYMILFGGKIQVSSVFHEDNNVDHGTTIKLIFPKEVFQS
jgi:signal transduction histidine kinase